MAEVRRMADSFSMVRLPAVARFPADKVRLEDTEIGLLTDTPAALETVRDSKAEVALPDMI